MRWIEIDKKRPTHGQLVWVWDMYNNDKFLIRYMGSEDGCFIYQEDIRFPVWAPLNEDDSVT